SRLQFVGIERYSTTRRGRIESRQRSTSPKRKGTDRVVGQVFNLSRSSDRLKTCPTWGGEGVMEPVIETRGLTKSFRGKMAVRRLNLTVPRGAIFAFLGDNGAGKSTTIRMLTGLLRPDAGQARILGQDCWIGAARLRQRVGYVPEKPKFYDWM